jgi:hypothetical protein
MMCSIHGLLGYSVLIDYYHDLQQSGSSTQLLIWYVANLILLFLTVRVKNKSAATLALGVFLVSLCFFHLYLSFKLIEINSGYPFFEPVRVIIFLLFARITLGLLCEVRM